MPPSYIPLCKTLSSFEIELRRLDPDLAIPYWDSTMDQNLPASRDSIMWDDDFMGRTDENGTVITGPGAHWITLTVIFGFRKVIAKILGQRAKTSADLLGRSVYGACTQVGLGRNAIESTKTSKCKRS